MGPRIAFFNDTSVTNHFGCTAVVGRILREIEARGGDIKYRWPVAEDWQPHTATLEAEAVDVVVVNGEGSIHHSAERPRTRQLCALGEFAKERLGAKAFLINASIEALEAEEIEKLRRFDAISVRETASKTYLSSHGIESRVAGDLSFGTSPSTSSTRSGVLVTDSVKREVSDLLAGFAAETHAQFLSMRTKRTLIEKMKALFQGRAVLTQKGALDPRLEQNLQDFMIEIGNKELIVTGRFHSVCLALVSRTPVLALESNTSKISSILNDALGSSDRMLSTDALKARAIEHAFSSWTKAEIDHLDGYMSDVLHTQKSVFDEICA